MLSTLFFEPIRRIERFGWRKMAENEKLASYYFLVRGREATGHQGDTRRVTEKFRQFAFDYDRDNFVFAEKHTKIGHVFARLGLCRVTEYHSFRRIDDTQ